MGEPGTSRPARSEENTINAHSTRSLSVDGHHFRVTSRWQDADTGSSPTYVLVHGIGMSHPYLMRLARQLEQTGTTYTFDLPGFGGTARPARALSVEAHAHLLGLALDWIGVSDAVLVGHSMGAQFVTELARTRPDLARAIVLMGPVTDPRRPTGPKQARDLILDALQEPWTGNTLTAGAYLRCGFPYFFQTLPGMLAYRTDRALADVVAPALVLRGSRDLVARTPWCQQLADTARDGELCEIEGKHHLVQFSAAQETSAAIVDFLRRRALAGPGVAA